MPEKPEVGLRNHSVQEASVTETRQQRSTSKQASKRQELLTRQSVRATDSGSFPHVVSADGNPQSRRDPDITPRYRWGSARSM